MGHHPDVVALESRPSRQHGAVRDGPALLTGLVCCGRCRARMTIRCYVVDRVRRQYQLAEPENRLVVRQPERDWEQAMAERQRLGEEHDRFTARCPVRRSASQPAPSSSEATSRPSTDRRR